MSEMRRARKHLDQVDLSTITEGYQLINLSTITEGYYSICDPPKSSLGAFNFAIPYNRTSQCEWKVYFSVSGRRVIFV